MKTRRYASIHKITIMLNEKLPWRPLQEARSHLLVWKLTNNRGGVARRSAVPG